VGAVVVTCIACTAFSAGKACCCDGQRPRAHTHCLVLTFASCFMLHAIGIGLSRMWQYLRAQHCSACGACLHCSGCSWRSRLLPASAQLTHISLVRCHVVLSGCSIAWLLLVSSAGCAAQVERGMSQHITHKLQWIQAGIKADCVFRCLQLFVGTSHAWLLWKPHKAV
jgi:hypothetical protein